MLGISVVWCITKEQSEKMEQESMCKTHKAYFYCIMFIVHYICPNIGKVDQKVSLQYP
jgi:hypothetical protein